MPEDETVTTEEAEESTTTDEAVISHCRHCGKPAEFDTSLEADWLCRNCDRYQDTVVCPTCHQTARASLMEPEAVPPPAKAKRK